VELSRDKLFSPVSPLLIDVIIGYNKEAKEKSPFARDDAEGSTNMLTNYIKAAMGRARYEILPSDRTFYGEIPGFDGVFANTESLEACRDQLQEVLEGWILLRVSLHFPLPSVDGMELVVGEAA
jgi:predicted RNase H-like HicB family nuclease